MSDENKDELPEISKPYKASTKVIVLAIIVIVASIAMLIANNGRVKENDTKSILDNLISKSSFELNIPDIVYQQESIEVRDSSLIEIGSDYLVFKASVFVDVNADPLGLYEKPDTLNKYYVANNDKGITFFKFRTGYPEYENCTLINWCTDTTAYGMMIADIITEDEALQLLGISSDLLLEYTENKSVDTEENSENIVYTIKDKLTFELPSFKSEIQQVDLDGYSIFYMNKTMVFVVIYNEFDADTDLFGGESEYRVDDALVIRYLSENPFKDDEIDALNDYNIFISTIDDITSTIKYQ